MSPKLPAGTLTQSTAFSSGCWMPTAGWSVLLQQETWVQLQVHFPSCFLADGLFCVPTKFSTALVKNSHWGEVVQTLESCEMKEKCYCVSQVEYYEVVWKSAGHREKQVKVDFQGFGSSLVGTAEPSCRV